MANLTYDVIIVGSGIGGLTCASYLAAHGLRVVVIEKNKEPGGYCTSFVRRGFVVDSTIHAIQNCAEKSILYKIFNELGIYQDLNLIRRDPTDTIFTDNEVFHINHDPIQTIANFQKAFPLERLNLQKFLTFLYSADFLTIFFKYKNVSFKTVLDSCFEDNRLKAVFEIFLGNIGSFAEKTSAVSAFSLLRQFIFFGGYYPKGGMQKIPDLLVSQIKANGGELLLGNQVERILVDRGSCIGVQLKNNVTINSKVVVSNSDLTHTFNKLIGGVESGAIRGRLTSRIPSYSIYIVYLLLNKSLKDELKTGPGIWYVPNSKLICEKSNFETDSIVRGMFCSVSSKLDQDLMPPGHDIVRIMTSSMSHDANYWKKNAKDVSSGLKVQAGLIIKDLDKFILCEGRATSLTMENYSLNREGAVSGWMNSVNQVQEDLFSMSPEIRGLYFVGHWISEKYGNGGIAMVCSGGRKVAMRVIRNFNKKFKMDV